MTPFVLYITAAIMFGFSAYTLIKAILQARRIKASQEWPPVMAQVTGKEVVRQRSSKGHVSYFPEVRYAYSVMGSEFTGHLRLPGIWTSNSAQKALDEFPPTLEVRYNPEKPAENSHAYDKVKVGDYVLVVVTFLLGLVVLLVNPG
ncbi:MAG: DUF3592 domain-containing protein [Veillonellaceae bacterium]|nr:DUF3592 domain-containing protein [Veillonellaceae bacterium]